MQTRGPLRRSRLDRCRAALLAFALLLPMATVSAHPRLTAATPAANARLAAPPVSLSLTFQESVTLALSRLSLVDSAGRAVALDTLRALPTDAKTLTARIRGALKAGRYVVKWQAAGADGHPVRGEFTFEILPEAFAPPALDLSASHMGMLEETDGFGVESPTYVAVRAVLATGLVALIGLLSLRWFVLPRTDWATADALLERSSSTWAALALGAVAVATLARLAAQHAAMFGTGEPWTSASMSALLLQSEWGRAWYIAFAATGVGFVGVLEIRRARARGWAVLTVATLTLVVTVALSGHAAAATSPATAIGLHVFHVIGAGGWVGGLAATMLVAVPVALAGDDSMRHKRVAALVQAFSPTALAFAGLMAITGVIAAWRNLGSIEALWRSEYGEVLLVKLALLSVAAGTGAFNWKRVLPALGSETATKRLRRSASVELAAALTVLVVTAVLVATPMPLE